MALSFCSSYPEYQLPFLTTEEVSDFDPDSLLLPFAHDFEDDGAAAGAQLQLDSDGLISLSPTEATTFPLNELNPKRQRTFPANYDHYCYNPLPWELNILQHGYANLPDLIIPAVAAPVMPQLETPAGDNAEAEKKQSLSAQSVAARQRRRRISDKTQELGKLIPGGNKMNTAEMFQAAANYVRFLQCQISILQLMGGDDQSPSPPNELQTILASHRIQHKLCSERSCLVPRELLLSLVNRPELQAVTEEIDELLLVKKEQ